MAKQKVKIKEGRPTKSATARSEKVNFRVTEKCKKEIEKAVKHLKKTGNDKATQSDAVEVAITHN